MLMHLLRLAINGTVSMPLEIREEIGLTHPRAETYLRGTGAKYTLNH